MFETVAVANFATSPVKLLLVGWPGFEPGNTAF